MQHSAFIQGAGGKKKRTSSTTASTVRVATEAPNTLQSKNTARVIDLIAEGPIAGLVNGAQSIYFDDTPLQNSDGTYNFQGVVWEAKDGDPDQDPLSGFTQAEVEVAVGAEVTYSSPVVRTISEPDIDAVRVKIRMPQLTYQDPNSGDLVGTSVQFQIEVQPSGGAYSLATLQNVSNPVTISGKSTSPYEVAYRVPLTGSAPWNIRVTRLTADSGTVTLQNDTIWSTYTKLIDAKFRYPDSALVGISLDAADFGTEIPTRAYEVYGKEIQIPSNYNPDTRVYTGVWDGTFAVDYSNNPAWVLYDLLTNARYGLGEFIDADQIDKFSLYDIGVYCDELVDDGYGEEEPRFTFNGVIETRQEAYDVINAITSAFRGMAYWGSGTVNVTQDAPADPVKLVTPANVIDGHFDYSGTGLKARHTVVKVTWNDPEDNYKAAIAIVEDKEAIAAYGWRELDTVAFGCTSRGQAVRYGRWILDSEKNETETVTYKAGFDHLDVRPGDIIAVADPAYAAVRLGGRVVTPGTTSIVIDHAITIESGETYTLSVVLPDGSIEERTLTNSPGSATTLTWSGALSDTPLAGAMWVVSASNVEPRKFRVLAIREAEKAVYEITALFHDPNKYDRVESNLVVERPSYTALPTGPLSPPTDLRFNEYLYQAGPAVRSAITVGWTNSRDARVTQYQVEFKGPNDPEYRLLGEVSGNSIDYQDNTDGLYSFRVRGVEGITGVKSAYLTLDYEAGGLLAPPSDVDDFNIQIVGTTAYLSWDAVTDLDLDHYVIKFSNATSGASWGSANVLMDRISRDATGISVQAMVGTYLIKAVDTSGVESESESLIVSTISALDGLNVVETVTEHPAFSGSTADVTVVDGVLRLSGVDTVDDWADVDAVTNWDIGDNGIEALGVYEFANSVDLGAVYTSRLTSNMTVYGADLLSNVDEWTDVDAIDNWDGGDPSKWGVELQVRTTEDNPAGSPTWSDWARFVVGDYTARAFEFRLILYSYQTGITPIVEELSVSVDMPDRQAGDNDVTCTAGGVTVTFTPAFKARPSLGLAPQDLDTGDYWLITSLSATGFHIEFFNDSAVSIERTFDWVAVGYGRVVT